MEELPIAAALQARLLQLAPRPPEDPQPSAPPLDEHGFVADSYTKRQQPGFFAKLFASRHVPNLSEGDRENGMCFGARFEVNEDELLALARDWLRGLWLLPSDLTAEVNLFCCITFSFIAGFQSLKLGPVTPVYLPFFSFETKTKSYYAGQVVVRKGPKGPTRTVHLPGGEQKKWEERVPVSFLLLFSKVIWSLNIIILCLLPSTPIPCFGN